MFYFTQFKKFILFQIFFRESLKKLNTKCHELSKLNNEDVLLARQKKVENDFSNLEKLANQKYMEMENLSRLFTYNNESHDLESWINTQLQIAMNEDYGHDYEHLLTLKSKFDEFKQSVKTGSKRFAFCEESTQFLIDCSPLFSREILQRQDKLRYAWTLLLEYIESRDRKLQAAEQLHKFNRDVDEMQDRIREKFSTLSNELGRDAKHACSLILKHEVFEHELNQLNEKLKFLMQEGGNLQSIHSGSNADQIDDHLVSLAAKWQKLKNATVERGNTLFASYELQKFLAQVRDFYEWSLLLLTEMRTDHKIRDLQTAEWIKHEHQRLYFEIDARFSVFCEIQKTGTNLLNQNSYEIEIKKNKEMLDDIFNELKQEWQSRNEWIEQVK